MHALADRLAANNGSVRNRGFDRSLSCSLRDLEIVYAGRLKDGHLVDIKKSESRDAQIRLTMTSDDLLSLVDGHLKLGSAWATGRVKVEAGVRDLLKLRTFFGASRTPARASRPPPAPPASPGPRSAIQFESADRLLSDCSRRAVTRRTDHRTASRLW